jgi:hypothetical protein
MPTMPAESAVKQRDDSEACDLAPGSACNHGVQIIAALAVCEVCVLVTVQTAVPPSAAEQAVVVATLYPFGRAPPVNNAGVAAQLATVTADALPAFLAA